MIKILDYEGTETYYLVKERIGAMFELLSSEDVECITDDIFKINTLPRILKFIKNQITYEELTTKEDENLYEVKLRKYLKENYNINLYYK